MKLEKYVPGQLDRGRSTFVEILWIITQGLFFSTWVPGSGLRVRLLRLFGASIGIGVVIKPRVRVKFPWRIQVNNYSWIGEDVWIDNLAEVVIEESCCLSQGAYICAGTHDWRRGDFSLITKPIRIRRGSWIAAKAYVGPGVSIGTNVILAAGSVAVKDLESNAIYSGNPAVLIKKVRESQGS